MILLQNAIVYANCSSGLIAFAKNNSCTIYLNHIINRTIYVVYKSGRAIVLLGSILNLNFRAYSNSLSCLCCSLFFMQNFIRKYLSQTRGRSLFSQMTSQLTWSIPEMTEAISSPGLCSTVPG